MKKYLSILIALIIIPFIVNASTLEAGNNISLGDNVDGNKIVFANSVTSNESVDGFEMIFGNNIISSSTSLYGIYAGNSVIVNGNIEKDLFIAGNNITLSNTSIISRDAYILGSSVTILTNIGRNLFVGAETVDLSGITINGDAHISASEIIVNEGTVITGTLYYEESTNIENIDLASIGNISITYEDIEEEVESSNAKEVIIDKISSAIMSFIKTFVTLIVILLLVPKIKNKLNENKLTSAPVIFKNIGIGAATLFITPISIFVALCTTILSPLSLVIAALYAIGIYLSFIFSAYIIGHNVLIRTKNKDNIYLVSLVGSAIYAIVKIIPIFGGIASFICLLYGLGVLTNNVIKFTVIKNK